MQIGETFQWLGYSLDTGNLLWGPTTTVFPTGYQYFGSGLGIGQCAVNAYGNIYVQGYGGEVWCYSTATGNLLWRFGSGGPGNSTDDGINSPWGLLPTMISAIADGKVYVYSQQHGNGAQSPYYKGEMIWVLNATTGQQIWSMPFQGPNSGGPGYPEGSIADGEYVNQNMYDNQIYAFGQGPSATTVTAPQTAIYRRAESSVARNSLGRFRRYKAESTSSKLPIWCSSSIRSKRERMDAISSTCKNHAPPTSLE